MWTSAPILDDVTVICLHSHGVLLCFVPQLVLRVIVSTRCGHVIFSSR